MYKIKNKTFNYYYERVMDKKRPSVHYQKILPLIFIKPHVHLFNLIGVQLGSHESLVRNLRQLSVDIVEHNKIFNNQTLVTMKTLTMITVHKFKKLIIIGHMYSTYRLWV